MSWVVNPSLARTTKPRMPSSAFAHTTATSSTPPFVIHIFAPFSTQSEPSRLASSSLTRVAAESGSVRPSSR